MHLDGRHMQPCWTAEASATGALAARPSKERACGENEKVVLKHGGSIGSMARHGWPYRHTHTHDEAVVETYCTSCEAALGDMPIILAMDTHPIHIGEPILRCTTSLGLHVVVVPSRRTWFLQPLDAKVFRQTHWDSNVINVYANYEGLLFCFMSIVANKNNGRWTEI